MMTSNRSAAADVSNAARRWTECLERFKYSVDQMYEICRDSANINGCKEALLYLSNATHDFEALIGMINVEKEWTEETEGKPQAVAWEVKATSNTTSNPWHLVKGRRRKSFEASSDTSSEDVKEPKKTSVYERLAYNLPRPTRSTSSPDVIDPGGLQQSNNSNLMCPRSAMDLPQTKASMAKMAYSRERLWKGRVKPLLEEKLQRRQSARLTYSQVAKRQAPLVSKVQTVPEVTRGSREPSLASISETNEENDDNLSTCTMADVIVVAEPLRNETEALLNELNGDDEWRAMTAEEESLAQEGESLQKEILEEEMSSIDDEFEREANRRFGRKKSWKEVVDQWSDRNAKIHASPDLVYRQPGEVAAVHEKLLSPSRKRTDFPKQLAERQQKAFELRQKLLDDKAARLKALHQKVEEVKRQKTALEEKKRALLASKMSTAISNRERNLAEVVKKAREDDYKIQEVQMIKLLEDMSRRMELNTKEKERQAKLAEIAEQQARKAEANAAKHAQVVENRAAAAASKVEQIEKKEAKIALVTAARNEKLEETRQKQRIVAQKIDKLREKENQLTTKNEAEESQTENIEPVKGPSVDASLPEPAPQFVMDSLLGTAAGKYQFPKKCDACDIVIPSSIAATAHIVSAKHVTARQLEAPPTTPQEFVREFNTFSSVSIHQQPPDDPSPDPAAVLRKKKSKIRQKLLKTSVEVPLSSDPIEKQLFKLLKELETATSSCLKANDISKANQATIERIFTDVSSYLANSPAKDKLRIRIFHSPCPLLVAQMLGVKTFTTSGHTPAIRRLFMKTCAFLGPLLGIDSLKQDGLFSPMLVTLMEATVNQMAISANDQVVAALMILVESMPSGDFCKAAKERLAAIGSFLLAHDLADCLRQYLKTVEGTGLELSPRVLTSPIAVITSVVVGLLSGASEVPGQCEPSVALLEATVVTVVDRIYEALTKTVTLPPSLVGHFFSCFGTIVIHLAPTKPTILKSVLLSADAQTAFKGVIAANAILSRRIQGLESNNFRLLAVRVLAYLARLDPQIGNFCFLGWQDSVLQSLCRVTFELQCPPAMRHGVLEALIVIVREEASAVDAIVATDFTVNWLVLFLERLISGKITENDDSRYLIPVEHRLRFLDFFEAFRNKCPVSPILGPLQKLRKAFHKPSTKLTDDEESAPASDGPQPECPPKPPASSTTKSKKSRSFVASPFNFTLLRRRLDRLDSSSPASLPKADSLPLAVSTKTGMNGDLQHKSAEAEDDNDSQNGLCDASESREATAAVVRPTHHENSPTTMLLNSHKLEMEAAAFFRNEINGDGRDASMSPDIMDDDDDDMLDEDEDDLDSFEIDPLVLTKLTTQYSLFPPLPPAAPPITLTFEPVPYAPEEFLFPKLPYIYERFADIFGLEEIGCVPLPRLMELRKYLATLPQIEQFFEAIPFANLVHTSINLVRTILHLLDDLDEVNDLLIRHVRSYMGFLCTCGLRSLRFRATFERHRAAHWLGMLRFEPLRYDVVSALCQFTTEMCTLYTDDNFFHFLTEIISTYQYCMDNSDQRVFIFNYVARLLQTYPFFMYRAYTQLTCTTFNEFLLIVDRISRCDMLLSFGLDKSEPILSSAVYLIIKFFDITIDNFHEERGDYHMVVSRLCRLMEIMNQLLRNTPAFYTAFKHPSVMHNVCALQNLLVEGDEITKALPPLQHSSPQRKRRSTLDNTSPNSSGPDIVDIDTNLPSIEHGPPERKYPRKCVSQDSIDSTERPITSESLFPLPSTELVPVDAKTSFRTRDAFLHLYRQRKISRFYITNLKRTTIRLVGALCIASPSHRDIAAEYNMVASIFKTARTGELIKTDYIPHVRRTLIDLCTGHPKNIAALKEVEQHPAHLVSKEDILALLLPEGNQP
uniref:SCAPER_N domain-containing protein n=1 Tax=Panagrellus redivivus TaxID=6233 RepID=A0A7E4UR85_PANRE